MSDVDIPAEDEDMAELAPPVRDLSAKKTLRERCERAGLALEEVPVGDISRLRLGMKCGRDVRWLYFASDESIDDLLSIKFEKYVFLAGLQAICSYEAGTIEAGVRPAAPMVPLNIIYRRLFGIARPFEKFDVESAKTILVSNQEGLPNIEISPASEQFFKVARPVNQLRLTLKLSNCQVGTHDSALALLNKVADSVLFQLDLLTDVAMVLDRERTRPTLGRRPKVKGKAAELQYPKTQFDSAPLSLYWYARSASGMPLLQFLAFYQVIEFYFPIYSQTEAQRKLKAILKDPTFRGDRDADVARLLAAIHVSRSGAFGDERSQLRATLGECCDSDSLRRFFEADPERKEFFSTKKKSLPYHQIPLANSAIDLRNDVADRVYDIRCKIVHTKTDTRDGSVELLLPFTPEAEQLSFDIDLVQHLAQLVLVASSSPFNVHG